MEQQNHNQKHDKPEHAPNHSHNHSAHGRQAHGDGSAEDKKLADGDAPASDGSDAKNTGEQHAAPPAADDRQRKDKAAIDDLTLRLDAANDKYLRLMAEFDNFKRRTAKEYQQLIEQANEKLMKDILEVRENFERAFKSHKEGADLQPFMDGMKMVFAKLDNVLHKHGLEIYSETGQEFDPQLHDAMMKSAHHEIPEHHIAEVLEKGYKLRGKVIKHSRVIVSSGKPDPGVPTESGDKEAKEAFESEAERLEEENIEPACP
jgi:molecular chaperone GrpE